MFNRFVEAHILHPINKSSEANVRNTKKEISIIARLFLLVPRHRASIINTSKTVAAIMLIVVIISFLHLSPCSRRAVRVEHDSNSSSVASLVFKIANPGLALFEN